MRLRAVKAEMGESLLVLGHHYQQDEVIAFADIRGDSYKLAKMAAESRDCRWIAFCGVHFMAETADILTGPEVGVVLPDMAAGCSMADMADLDSVEAAWSDLGEIVDTEDITPVTYINSAADLKAFCGRQARWDRLHVASNARALRADQRSPGGRACCSSPTSTSAGTPRARWASPSNRCPSGTRGSRSAAIPSRRSGIRA